MYTCPACGASFEAEEEFVAHMRGHLAPLGVDYAFLDVPAEHGAVYEAVFATDRPEEAAERLWLLPSYVPGVEVLESRPLDGRALLRFRVAGSPALLSAIILAALLLGGLVAAYFNLEQLKQVLQLPRSELMWVAIAVVGVAVLLLLLAGREERIIVIKGGG